MADFRALCARMADELDHYRQLLMDDRRATHALATEARAALAQPEPKTSRLHYCDVHGQQPENAWGCPECVREMRHQLAQPEPQGPTDEELASLYYVHCGGSDAMGQVGFEDAARAALARWSRPAIEPVPVSERLPGPEDCDAMRRCWWIEFDQQWFAAWTLDSVSPRRATHWLPHWALPVPGVEGADA